MPNWINIIVLIIYIFQLISLVAVIFIENKDPVTTLSWILVLSFLPIIGFILYLFLGRGLTYLTSKKLKLSHQIQKEMHTVPPRAQECFAPTMQIMAGTEFQYTDEGTQDYVGLIRMNYELAQASYTQNNDMIIFTDAKSKYEKLFEDIRNAKDSIHAIYFIISNTEISHEFVALLAEKAREGVTVRLIYDTLGNIIVPAKMFNPIKEAGGEVYRFFPLSYGNILHANYRNHHKIVVIDGQIGYTGGMNIGDEYMGLHPRKTPWRDTHMRITGDAVASLQFMFLMDLYYSLPKQTNIQEYFKVNYFPEPEHTGNMGLQIVSSGPDDRSEAIKRAMVDMISSAKETLYIQTPYLMPDQAVMEAIQNAAASGVKVQLMLPGVPDKRIVYLVTYSYIQNMLDYGVEVYIYNGFLHAKMIVVDDKLSTIGTTNLDMRSFSLHFEVNNFIYDSSVSKECGDIFRRDLQDCYQMTPEIYAKRSRIQRFFEKIFRLFAPLM